MSQHWAAARIARGLGPEELIEDARLKWPNLHIADKPLEYLPLLERYRERRRCQLQGATALFIQHQLAPLTARLRAWQSDGLTRSRTLLVDIPYSTCDSVQDAVAHRFSSPDQIAEPFLDPFMGYQEAQQTRTLRILERIADSHDGGPIVIVDDGAYFLRFLSNSLVSEELRECFRGARVVEQTTRGHRYLESGEGHKLIQDFGLIAVSVARSATKVRFEAPYIGEAVAQAMKRTIVRHEVEPSRALILGFGSVGAASLGAFRQVFPPLTVDVIDADMGRLQAGRDAGCRASRALPAVLPVNERYDLVLGCTGGTSFTWENRMLLQKEAILASGSSAAVELDRERLVEIARKDPKKDLHLLTRQEEASDSIHVDLRFGHGQDQTFTILNAGFPVNFDGAAEHIPTVLIQPTHVLLYAGVAQAIKTEVPGLRLLEPTEDHWIFEEAFEALIGALDVEYYLREGKPRDV